MKLSLAEGLYLIALDDEEGRLLAAAEKTIIPGLISASILEHSLPRQLQHFLLILQYEQLNIPLDAVGPSSQSF